MPKKLTSTTHGDRPSCCGRPMNVGQRLKSGRVQYYCPICKAKETPGKPAKVGRPPKPDALPQAERTKRWLESMTPEQRAERTEANRLRRLRLRQAEKKKKSEDNA